MGPVAQMRNLKVVNGELVFAGGSLETVSGKESIRQSVECRLRTVRGEWFLDGSLGVPYFDGILGAKNPKLEAARAILRQEILATPGVTGLVSLTTSFDASNRSLTVAFVASSDAGLVEGSV